MTTGKRGLGEALQVDELRGHNGYVDRISSGLTTGDVLRLMVKRSRPMIIIVGGFFLFMSLLLAPISIGAMLFMIGTLLFIFIFTFGLVFLMMLCTGKNAAKMLMENNYILLLKDKLVIQNQNDMGTLVLRNEVPLEKIDRIEHVQESFLKERKAKTNICLRIFTGIYLQPIGGLYPVASKKECLMIIHLKRPQEIHCSGRHTNGLFQFGDKREYVKEIIISADPSSHRRLMDQIAQ